MPFMYIHCSSIGAREYWMIMEDQAFLPSYDSARRPIPPSPPPPHISSASWPLFFLCVAGWAYWWEKGGGVVGGGAKSYDGEKVWSSLYHSILSDRGAHPHRTVMSTVFLFNTNLSKKQFLSYTFVEICYCILQFYGLIVCCRWKQCSKGLLWSFRGIIFKLTEEKYLKTMKKISEAEEKPFTSSLKICPKPAA